MDLLKKYFPSMEDEKIRQFNVLKEQLLWWNARINVISRQDTGFLETRHILHSLAIAKFCAFTPGTTLVDIGTGGGFPGLPLAILFPECHFTLIDSIGKKIKVVKELIRSIPVSNAEAIQARAEKITSSYEFVISRAVTAFPAFYAWTRKLVRTGSGNRIPKGILYLKGGDLSEELKDFRNRVQLEPVSQWFEEDFFRGKYVLYMPVRTGR